MNASQEYAEMAQRFFNHVSTKICAPCVEAGQNKHPALLDDPANCPCSCERVTGILDSARKIMWDLTSPDPTSRI